jgi:hypothetical protein
VQIIEWPVRRLEKVVARLLHDTALGDGAAMTPSLASLRDPPLAVSGFSVVRPSEDE